MGTFPLVCTLLAAAANAIPTSSSHSGDKFSWAKTKSVIAFGDSYTFVQGTHGHPNYSYIGDNLDLSFTPTQLFANRIVQNLTGTASGGPIWTQYLTNCGVEPGQTDSRKCSVQLWDFAYAGANTDTVLTPLHWPHTVSLERQVEQFEDYGDAALQRVLNKREALVAVWIGINDVNDLAKLRGKNATLTPLYEQLVATQEKLWSRIYDLGYRRFLLLNLPPLDRGPGNPSVNQTLIQTYNSILSRYASSFQRSHRDARVLLFDANAVLNRVFDDAAAYGFTNTTNFCPGYNQPDILTDPGKYGCGGGLDTYLWFNSGHLTSRVHGILSDKLKRWLRKQ